MNKIIYAVIIVILIIIIVVFLPKEEQITAVSFYDEITDLEIEFPESWKDMYTVEIIEQENRTIIFNYKDAMLFIITVFPQTQDMGGIERQPNHRVVLQNMDSIFAISIALDMPFEQGTEDFVKYGEMTGQIQDLVFKTRDSVSLINKEINENNEEANYIIEVDYPELAGNINMLMKEIAESNISAFKQRVAEWGDMDLDTGSSNGLWFWYKPIQLDDIVSIKFYMSDYYAGAAHPNHYTASFNYDMQQDREMTIEDIFSVSEEDYVTVLDPIVRLKLEQELEQMGAEGFLDEDKALVSKDSTINISSEGLMFTFDPYEVAPYAVGMLEVSVPFEDILGILNI